MNQDSDNHPATPSYNKVNFFMLIKGGASQFIKFVEDVFDAHENEKARTPDPVTKDDTLIHAEIQVGNSMILVADSKPDWPFTPGFPQVYVENAQEILTKAQSNGAEIITEVSDFYNGLNIARFKDPWENIWWLFEKSSENQHPEKLPTGSHEKNPSYIYSTIMEVMRNLEAPKR